MGAEVTLIHRGPQLLRAEDDDVARRFTEVFQRKINMLLNTPISRADSRGDEVVLRLSTNGSTLEVAADGLLVATGRVPNTDVLNVATAGVEVDERGYVKTDEFLETNVPGVWGYRPKVPA